MKRKKYAYILPQNNKRLSIDAVTFAGIDAIHDGPNTMSREIIEEKARHICERFKAETKAECISNDIDAFNQIVVGNYVNMYIEKQKVYMNDSTAHQREVELAKQQGDEFVVKYRIFVEQFVMGGNA